MAENPDCLQSKSCCYQGVFFLEALDNTLALLELAEPSRAATPITGSEEGLSQSTSRWPLCRCDHQAHNG
jgi:hypothetical protein